MNFYYGQIVSLSTNEIFVFGSNPEGRHGKGSAKTAKDKFGAQYGVGRGLTGRCWALPTKNLTANYFEKSTGITYPICGERSISKEHRNVKFYIAYNYDNKNLNGYTGDEIFEMFSFHKIPNNIIFHESFKHKFNTEEQKMKLQQYIEKLQELLKEHGDLELIYSTDDEGNEYNTVNYYPSIVNYIESDRCLIDDDDLEEWDESEYQKVICIN